MFVQRGTRLINFKNFEATTLVGRDCCVRTNILLAPHYDCAKDTEAKNVAQVRYAAIVCAGFEGVRKVSEMAGINAYS